MEKISRKSEAGTDVKAISTMRKPKTTCKPIVGVASVRPSASTAANTEAMTTSCGFTIDACMGCRLLLPRQRYS